MRILVADDDQWIRNLLAEVLTEDGHQVVAVSTPREALSLSDAEGWDLFLVDTLGQADHALTEECKAFAGELATRAPVILCTGRLWAQRVHPSELGIAGIISKPFDIDMLSQTVARIGSRG
jgi:DNA-binding response OmpR family regulator